VIIPFRSQFPLVFHGIDVTISPRAERRVVPKIQFLVATFWEKHCDGPPNCLCPGDAVFFAVSVQCPNLFYRKVDDSSHGDIVA
jgi:hypothetical protein